ncbi:hypothetical protein E2C01_039797 [Portunus trituberculatus]|uniref:Uncharacterized protein n=1 Tax=Portunus trituberculatus TaxID=210409 RepID=A0A5B7FM79_PORTR|nr:hypothetical protein [Portunus trituberculatus]
MSVWSRKSHHTTPRIASPQSRARQIPRPALPLLPNSPEQEGGKIKGEKYSHDRNEGKWTLYLKLVGKNNNPQGPSKLRKEGVTGLKLHLSIIQLKIHLTQHNAIH